MSLLNQARTATSAITATALIATASLQTPAASANNGVNCENGRSLGQFVIKSKLNDRYVSGGHHNDALKANLRDQPAPGSEGVFELFDVSNLPGAVRNTFALRSVKNPNEWWRVKNNDETVLLDSYQCKSDRESTTFVATGLGGRMALQSRKNDKWLKVNNDDRLKASVDNPNGRDKSIFLFSQVTQVPGPAELQPNPEPSPQPEQPVNLNGWWRGNDNRLFHISVNGSNVTIKGFQSSGQPLNISTGIVNGALISGNWNNYCHGARGSFAFSLRNGALDKVGGNLSTQTLVRINTPANVNLSAQPSCDTPQPPQDQAPTNLNGWWKGNNSGYYNILQTQEIPGQNNFRMRGYTNSGQLLNTLIGRTRGNRITGRWTNACDQRSGNITLEVRNGELVKVSGSATANTRWSTTNNPPRTLRNSCPQENPEPRAQASKQVLSLTKTVYIVDHDSLSRNETGQRTFSKTLQLKRPQSNGTRFSAFFPSSNKTRFCVDNEVRSDDWDKVWIDSNGNANLGVEVKLYEGTSCRGRLIGTYVYRKILTVAPGQTGRYEVPLPSNEGSSVRVTYTLSNRTAR
ncbi:hypothetical protein [Synechococcus sp. BS55D]|uniref:hypothetical protein n=1 Tax=Synechococcus sp. BS55D TaxID=2055943 RepID=UPI00103AFF2C|nr:hypothetical protein [Synechococcus sp. BS55D]TCD57885.1 hypothetical protein CWE16_00715 [Synechococcus sp. BS55D]